MKNKLLSKLVMAATVLLAFVMTSTSLKAQSTCGIYRIVNNMTCPMMVSYTRTCNGVVCGSSTGTSIAPGVPFNVPACTGCSGPCDITVTLLKINGVTVSPAVTVNSSNTTGSFSTSYCTGSSGFMSWDPTVTKVN